MSDILERLKRRIEEGRGWTVKLLTDCFDEIRALRKRVEELEGQLDRIAKYKVKTYLGRGHYCVYRSDIDGIKAIAQNVIKNRTERGVFITDEQIDAAWRFVPEEQGCGIEDDESFSLHVLAQFLIVRCEECGGSGEGDGSKDEYGYAKNCPTCDGHGWVVKDE